MYCLNYAIKAHKNADQFDGIHHGLQRGTLLTESMEGESRTRTTAGTLEEDTRYSVVKGDTHVAFGADVLPVDFYKHGASLTQALRLMERPDGRMAGRVNSKGHERAENLVERNQAFRISRRELFDEDNPQINQFSASIDGCRKLNGYWLRISASFCCYAIVRTGDLCIGISKCLCIKLTLWKEASCLHSDV